MTAPTAYAYEVAAFQTVNQFKGGAKALGPLVGMNGSVLAHKASLTDEANHLTVPQARTIMQATSDCRMLFGLAEDLDFVCTAGAAVGVEGVERSIASATKDFGQYLSAVSDAVADRVVTLNELREIDRTLGQHQAAVNRLRTACAALMRGGL